MGIKQINQNNSVETVEVEVKVLGVDADLILQALENLGAKKTLDDITYIEGFDFILENQKKFNPKEASQRFSKLFSAIEKISSGVNTLISQGAYLRIRKEGSKCEVILKTPVEKKVHDVKSEREISIPIRQSEWNDVRAELIATGLARIAVQEKKRISFFYRELNVRYDIDTWPKIPPYLEVEGKDKATITEALKRIKLDIAQSTPMTGKQVFEKYNIDPTNLIF